MYMLFIIMQFWKKFKNTFLNTHTYAEFDIDVLSEEERRHITGDRHTI